MKKPLISVVMPAYNHERFIEETTKSVLEQSVNDLELIVIDDGSQDKTGEIIKSFDDKRVHYHYQENQDAFNALNNGLAKTRGRFVAIINSDDTYTTNRFERLLEHQKSKKAACLFSDVIPMDDNSNPLLDPEFGWNVWHQNNRNVFFSHDRDIYTGFLNGNFMVTTSNLFMKKEVVTKVGGFAPLRYLHDYDYIFRIMLAYPKGVHYIDEEQLLYYRIHGGNTLSEAAITGREQDQEVIRKYMLAKVPENAQKYVQQGTNRLIQLQEELNAVKTELENMKTQETTQVAPNVPSLKQRITNKLARVVQK